MNSSEEILSGLKGVQSIETKSFEVVSKKLLIDDGKYNYGLNLDNVDAIVYKGDLQVDDNTLTLGDFKLYYKDKLLCFNKDCTGFLIKSKTEDCK